MKKIISNSIVVVFFSLFIISCAGDDLEEIQSAEYNAQLGNIFIYDSDLVGEWKIGTIAVNRNVDLNGDGESSNDLLLETSCFESMIYTFKGNKTFTIINPTLELTEIDNKDEFKCQNPTTISGKWSLKDDMLTLYIKRNNLEYTETKHLILIEDSFTLEINEDESKDLINDKGNSSAAGLSVVALEFQRTSRKL